MSIKKGPISKRKDHLSSTLFLGDMLVLRGVCFFCILNSSSLLDLKRMLYLWIYVYIYILTVSLFIYIYILYVGESLQYLFDLNLGRLEKIYLWKQLGLGRVLWVLLLGSWFRIHVFLSIHTYFSYIYRLYTVLLSLPKIKSWNFTWPTSS